MKMTIGHLYLLEIQSLLEVVKWMIMIFENFMVDTYSYTYKYLHRVYIKYMYLYFFLEFPFGSLTDITFFLLRFMHLIIICIFLFSLLSLVIINDAFKNLSANYTWIISQTLLIACFCCNSWIEI